MMRLAMLMLQYVAVSLPCPFSSKTACSKNEQLNCLFSPSRALFLWAQISGEEWNEDLGTVTVIDVRLAKEADEKLLFL